MQVLEGIYDGKIVRPIGHLRASPNSRVIITVMGEVAQHDEKGTRLEDVAGCLRYDGEPQTLADMESAIGKGVMEGRR